VVIFVLLDNSYPTLKNWTQIDTEKRGFFLD